jgi:hypothetical protein
MDHQLSHPSFKNVKNTLMNLMDLTGIMIVIIFAVGIIMSIWIKHSEGLCHKNMLIYAESINEVIGNQTSLEISEESYN